MSYTHKRQGEREVWVEDQRTQPGRMKGACGAHRGICWSTGDRPVGHTSADQSGQERTKGQTVEHNSLRKTSKQTCLPGHWMSSFLQLQRETHNTHTLLITSGQSPLHLVILITCKQSDSTTFI